MDYKDIRTLKFLEEIEKSQVPTQRALAKRLNVSLGLVNSFIKRLIQKGYFKVTTIPKNRVKYILTPKGAAEKARLTYEFIQYSFLFYKDSRNKLHNLFNELSNHGVRQIVFYGVSDFAEIAYLSLQETNIRLVAVIDNVKNGKKFLNFVVESPDKLNLLKYDRIIITDTQQHERILNDLLAKGILPQKIVVSDLWQT